MAYDFSTLKKGLTGTEEWLKKEFSSIRTGQANPMVLDIVRVEVYGAPMSLNELASITIEGARTLRVSPWDKSQVKHVEEAIAKANLGLSVSIDDQGLRINFPELTTERRSEFVKAAKDKLEDARKQVRLHRDNTIKDIQNKEKDGGMGKDEVFRLKNDTQKQVDEINKKLETLFEKKEKEILG